MSYRKEHQSVIHQGLQNKENYEFQNAVDFTNISSKQLELLWKETLEKECMDFVLVCMKTDKSLEILFHKNKYTKNTNH
jgi:hypothetical protein